MPTERLSDDVLAAADIVGDHPEPVEYEAAPHDAPTTKVVKASSKGVRHK